MLHNVGRKERYIRMAAGVAAGAAAARAHGWPRAALGTIAAAGLGTAATGYCPINRAVGRDSYARESPLEQGLRDTELRRHAATHSALGSTPTTDTAQPRVTRESDMFGNSGEPRRS
jgi:hypothetical protein